MHPTSINMEAEMRMNIYPEGYSLDLLDGEWNWESNTRGVVFVARGYQEASTHDSPINMHDHIQSGFVVEVDGSIVYMDDSGDRGYLIFIRSSNNMVVAVSILYDPDYNSMTDIEHRMGLL